MKKRLLAILMVVTFVVSGINISFGDNSVEYYAESDNELVQAENQLNAKVIEIRDRQIKEFEKNNNSEKEAKEHKDYLKNLKSYKDFKTNVKVAEIEKELKNNNSLMNLNFVELCKEIEKYEEMNPLVDIKKVVKHFNSLSGLKEKNQKLACLLSESFALSYAEWTTLTTSEKLLIASSPSNALTTNSCKEKAFNYTAQKFGGNGLGDKSDGFRHGLWNALMTRDISRAWAEAYATAHENKTSQQLNTKAADGYYEYQHRNMDLHNNQVGRDQVSWYEYSFNCSDSTLITRISNKLTNKATDIIWLH